MRLFSRDKRIGLRLTETGERILRYARQMFQLEERIRQTAYLPSGTERFLIHALAGFQQSYLGVQVEIHNLIAGRISLITDHVRHTPYHFPQETVVFGLAPVPGGHRFYNNIFLRLEDSNCPEDDEPKHFERALSPMEGAPKLPWTLYPVGLSCYNGYPGPDDKPWERANMGSGPKREPFKLPSYIDDNFYFHRAVPWEREPVYHQTDAMGITFAIEGDRVMLCYEDTGMLEDGCQRLLDTEALGVSFQTESKYTDPDNRPYTFDRDMLNHSRASRPTAGPLELGSLKAGKITLEY